MLIQGLMLLLLFQAGQQEKPKPPDPTAPPIKQDVPAKEQGKKAHPNAADPTQPPIEIEPKPAKPKEYSFNPVEAKKEMEVGAYHMRRGNWTAAVTRYEEAVKWNPKASEAYLKLAEAREKRGELEKAVEAYQKYLELEPHAKNRATVEKSIARLQKDIKE